MSHEIDWVAIRKEFETTDITLTALADKHRLKPGTVRSRKAREGWQKQENIEPSQSNDKHATQHKKKNATQRNKKKNENVATDHSDDAESNAEGQEEYPLIDLKPGGPTDNKSAVVTGEYETIWYDTLDDEEKELYHQIQLDKLKQVDNEIRLIEIRERRMMKRIADLAGIDFAEVEYFLIKEQTVFGIGKKESLRLEANLERIQRIEEALTKVQLSKGKFIELKHKLEKETGKTGKAGNLDTLVGLVMLGSDDL